jgi:hypothetical protein
MSPGELPRYNLSCGYQMSDHEEADLCAISHEEDVFVDKKNVNRQFDILMKLDELCGNLVNALYYLLAVPPHRVTLHLEDKASPNHFGGLYILECNITTQDTTCTDIALKSAVEGKIIFLNKSLVQVAPAICCLLKSFMLYLTIWMNPNSPIVFG